jgi:hypothetical protein
LTSILKQIEFKPYVNREKIYLLLGTDSEMTCCSRRYNNNSTSQLLLLFVKQKFPASVVVFVTASLSSRVLLIEDKEHNNKEYICLLLGSVPKLDFYNRSYNSSNIGLLLLLLVKMKVLAICVSNDSYKIKSGLRVQMYITGTSR